MGIMNNPDREQIVANMSEEERRNFTALEQSVKNKELYNQSIDLQKEMNDIDRAEFDAGVPMWDKDTIEINGVERAVTNSSGKKIAHSEKSLRMFYDWFGDSKAVNEKGEPINLYHGTRFDFSAFDGTKPIFLSDNRDVAVWFAIYGKGNSAGNIKTVYAKLENPLVIDAKGNMFGDIDFEGYRFNAETIASIAKERGYDGLIINNVKEAGSEEILSNDYVAFSPNQIKSTSNTGTFSKASNDIRYQFGGPSARTAALEKLDIAKKALENGYPKEEIRQLTGWFQGADGKWRFEISDKDAEIDKKGLALLSDEEHEFDLVLEDILNHEKLYEAYPELAELRVIATKEKNTGGSYNPDTNTIKINPEYPNIKSVIMHEVQHWIQHKEDFARGSNFAKTYRNLEYADIDILKSVKMILGPAYAYVSDKDIEEIIPILKTGYIEGDITDSQSEELEKWMETKGVEKDTFLFNNFAVAQSQYERVYGEIEARNTQTRMNMSEEERLATSPESTQDYSNDEAIVVFDDGTVANSYTYKPENVRIENGVVNLTYAFDKTPTINEVTKYIQDICKKTKDFATISPDWIVRTPKGAYREGHIIYSDKWKKMSNAQKERHNKYVMALNELLANASYLGDLPNKEIDNDKKKNVLKYHYFGVRVRIGKETFDIVFDTEQFKKDSTQKPMSVSLYNVYEKDKSPFGANTTVSKYPIGDSNRNITPSGRDVNSPRYQTEAEEKNLVVYHKISKDSLNKAIDLGGMPVPSLAIVKKDTDFVGFGGITLVGNKDMVNPQNAKNKVYNRDVWSITFPEDEYKKVTQKAKDTFTKKFGKFFDETDSKNDLSSLLYTAERAYPGSAINEFQYLL